MRALVLGETGIVLDRKAPQPVPRAGEVPVRVLAAGICETDLQLVQGYMGFRGVLGHEFVGIAEEGPLKGERVVGEINCACGTCDDCRRGLGNHCPHRSVLGILNHDGAFADFVSVPTTNLHRVPDEVGTHAAVFTEPLAAAFQIPAQTPVAPGDRVIVLGDGRLGNLCAQVLALSKCRLTVVGKHRAKLDVLRGCGIETALLDEFDAPRSADIVVDCTGSPAGFETACRIVRPRGRLVLKTTVAAGGPPSLAPLVIDEITVIGSRCGPFPAALDALRTQVVAVEPLISAVRPLEDGVAALELAGFPGVMKVVLTMGEPGNTLRAANREAINPIPSRF